MHLDRRYCITQAHSRYAKNVLRTEISLRPPNYVSDRGNHRYLFFTLKLPPSYGVSCVVYVAARLLQRELCWNKVDREC